MSNTKYPRIYLAIDNCVFYKRWTEPGEWAEKIRSLGVKYVEASADTEHDPLYSGPEAFEKWIGQVREAEEKYGVRVANLYSGHGTYSTLGLTHPDPSVRENMLTKWFFPMIETAGKLDCGLGFFAHAFPHRVLQSNEQYNAYVEMLEGMLSRMGEYAEQCGCREIGLEQMYTPHQYPWRIGDMRSLMKNLKQSGGRDFYFTEDLGHHHIKFMRPDREAFLAASYPDLWVGTDHAFALWKSKGKDAWNEIEEDMDRNPQLFSEKRDGDCYTWLSELGCYSPIVHLQQTNGLMSSHLPFTKENNAAGKIEPRRVLSAIREAYDRPAEQDMPKRCENIYLTMELFSGTTSNMTQVLETYAESVEYWRTVIPEDGMALDELLS